MPQVANFSKHILDEVWNFYLLVWSFGEFSFIKVDTDSHEASEVSLNVLFIYSKKYFFDLIQYHC